MKRVEYKNLGTPYKTEMLDIRNCDCMDLMAEYGDNHFDLAIVDPPYFDGPNKLGFYGGRYSNIGVDRGGYEKIGQWEVPQQPYFDELLRVSKQQIIWGINYYSINNLGPGRIIWDKCKTASTYSDAEIAYCSLHESVRIYVYMWNGMLQGSTSDGSMAEGNKALNEKRIAPTQKPVQLYRWLFSKYTTPGMKILDTHLGSGSIAIACHYANCTLVASEIEIKYYEAACERIERDTRQLTML